MTAPRVSPVRDDDLDRLAVNANKAESHAHRRKAPVVGEQFVDQGLALQALVDQPVVLRDDAKGLIELVETAVHEVDLDFDGAVGIVHVPTVAGERDVGRHPFDPWTATAEQAIQAAAFDQQGSPGALAQYHSAQEVTRARSGCLGIGGGLEVLRCVRLCASSRLCMPEWLASEFARRHAMVATAQLGTWDLAFGRPWPPGDKRLAAARRRMKLKALVHEWVWRLAIKDRDLPINQDLFERIGAMPEIGQSRSTVAKLYYESLAEGLPNIADMRDAGGSDDQGGGK